MMLKGANANVVTKELEKRVAKVQQMLPEGVSVEPYLNRSELVNRNISTVIRNLVEGAIIVFLVLIIFLGNVRAGLIVASVIPLAMLFAFILMRVFNVSANLMSLGAIDFGIDIEELNTVIRTAYAGETAGVVFENERRFDLVVRLDKEKVKDLNIDKLFVRTKDNIQLPVSEVASIELVNGPLQINRASRWPNRRLSGHGPRKGKPGTEEILPSAIPGDN